MGVLFLIQDRFSCASYQSCEDMKPGAGWATNSLLRAPAERGFPEARRLNSTDAADTCQEMWP